MASDAVGHWLEGAGRFPLLGPAEEVHLGGLVRAWQDHPAGPAGAPPAIRRRGLRARDRIVRCNLRLVAHITDRARRRGAVRLLELEDALQVGAIGLQRAAERFDPARGYKFSTYAFWWIRQSIARESEVVGSTIRLPSGLAARVARLDARRDVLAQELGRQPSPAELADDLGVSAVELADFMARGRGCSSLDSVHGEDDSLCLAEVIAAPAPDADPQLLELRRRLAGLDERSYRLVAGRWFSNPSIPVHRLAAEEGIRPVEALRLLRAAKAQLEGQLVFSLDQPAATLPAAPEPSSGDYAPVGQLRLL